MPSSATPAPAAQDNSRVRSVLESQALKFHIRTGGAKWECTVIDRATHERQKATRTGSSSSVSTTSSSSSVSSASSH
ncbi:hypothetical protein QBC47DRAFT_398079 [Echria macrotheca]|uniref:Uncharacterized protein n=1 Tax=Echria macrotheca TaxID=438768 RepID=A0AAJ0BJ74_9PEZI|nr:hypothetical protein QBC47DRAFT_398079 [Echria macrotheca]